MKNFSIQEHEMFNLCLQNIVETLKYEVKRNDSDSGSEQSQVILRIQTIFLGIIKSLSEDKCPLFIIRNQRLWKNCHLINNRLQLKIDEEAIFYKVTYGPKPSREFTHLIYTLGRIYKLLLTNTNCTRRELYYENTSLFEDQSQLDSVADKICSLLGVPQWDLGLYATSKGLVAGPLQITVPSGEIFDCSSFGGVAIPPDISAGTQLQSNAKFVLVVEKDSAFQKLLDEGFLENHGPCILVTGKGYPDLNTRLLVKLMWEQLNLPILTIVDADPYGIEIMCVYKYGSLKQSHIGDRLALPAVKWLGVHPSDIAELNITCSPLTDSDKRRINNMLLRPYTSENCYLMKELNKLIEIGGKCEIEDLSKISNGYLTDVYIPMKISSKQLL